MVCNSTYEINSLWKVDVKGPSLDWGLECADSFDELVWEGCVCRSGG